MWAIASLLLLLVIISMWVWINELEAKGDHSKKKSVANVQQFTLIMTVQ